jgi:hypothetical protein
MQVAPTAAIIEAMPIVASVPVVRDSTPSPRARTKELLAPSTMGRGQLIDLIV